jgi:Tol biopolymer transport system component
MTTERRLERDLPSHLVDIAMGPYPEYIDDVLSITAQRRQRPGWTFPERWIPMDTTTTPVPAARMPWRQLGVLALLLILVAGAAVVYVGSQQQTRPAPPFGLAANGNVLYAEDGDIVVADPVTGEANALVTGPDRDSGPVWSVDGTKIAFERGVGNLFVVREDGQGLTQVTPTPIRGLDSWSFSPDGRSITSFAYGEYGLSIMVVPSDGSAAPKLFPVPVTTDDGPPQYRPDGSEIMFIGQEPGAASRAVFALDPVAGTTRTIVTAPSERDISGATWSPDGSKISYNMHDTTAEGLSNRIYVASSDGSGVVAVNTDLGSTADWGWEGLWSNDGTRMVIGRAYQNPERFTTAIVPVDRSNAGIEIECPPGAPANDCTASWTWSPDDAMLIGSRENGAQFLADPQTGKIRPAPWTVTGYPQMQRRAP